VPPLADIQQRLRRAVVIGEAVGLEALLVGGRQAEKRLAIHHRHYEASLVTALLGKFPATAWLVGTPFLAQAATLFVRAHPPQAPCIAEYGEDFPSFLSTCPDADRVPYLQGFAQLEWHVGHVAVAVDRPVVAAQEFWRIDVAALSEATLTLQGGLRYLQASWPIDDLMKPYLMKRVPDQLSLTPADVWIEVRGARGEFQINRLEASDFMFRQAVLDGRSIGEAAERALDSSAAFEPGHALATLVTDGLVTAITLGADGEKS
jgi:hypothetical protein